MNRDPKMLLDLEIEGVLEPGERQALDSLLAPELEAERRELQALHRLLVAHRVAARPGFSRQVMRALPVAPWEARGLRALRVPAAALAALAALAAFLMGVGAGAAEGSSMLAAAGAVAEFTLATVLSGAGLLSASWRGVGLALGEALSLLSLVIFGVGVVALNLFLLMLLRRRQPQAAQARSGGR